MSETKFNIEQMREKFEEKVNSIKIRINSFIIPSAQAYGKLISEVEGAKSRAKKTHTDYRRLKRYDVLITDESKKLIRPLSENEKDIKYYVYSKQMFDIIHAGHLATEHGGKHKLEKYMKSQYVNITREIIQIYLELCLICKKKKAHRKKEVVVKSLISKEINERAQVDLIDMQGSQDGEYKFILNYQEHLTKFLILRPLKTKSTAEVAYILIDIFCVIGAPSVLQFDNDREFFNSVIQDVKDIWPDLKIVHDKPRYSQSQDSIEQVSSDVQDLLMNWMQDNNSTKWSEGLRFCQWKKNESFHTAIKQTPYEAMYGRKSHIEFQSSNLPPSIINSLVTEKELEEVLNSTKIDNC